MARRKHVPIRMCIFCGRKASKDELLRLALDSEGCPVWDRKQRLPGRGAYVCPQATCIQKLGTLKGHRKLVRAFRGRLRKSRPELVEILIEAAGGQKKHE